MASTVYFTLILLSLVHAIVASPFPSGFRDEVFNAKTGASKRGGDFYLRIMPLGASITKGDPAQPNVDTLKNGYRKPLRDRLREDQWKVNMVGSVGDYGTMNDRVSSGKGEPIYSYLLVVAYLCCTGERRAPRVAGIGHS